jgi:hypothetical protein
MVDVRDLLAVVDSLSASAAARKTLSDAIVELEALRETVRSLRSALPTCMVCGDSCAGWDRQFCACKSCAEGMTEDAKASLRGYPWLFILDRIEHKVQPELQLQLPF